jgi:hypothetical protein
MSGDNQTHPRSIELRRFRARGHLVLAEDDILKCAIAEISDKAATLIIEAERELPTDFTLELEGNVAVQRICKLVSQTGTVAKVSFPFRTPQPHKRGGLV